MKYKRNVKYNGIKDNDVVDVCLGIVYLHMYVF